MSTLLSAGGRHFRETTAILLANNDGWTERSNRWRTASSLWWPNKLGPEPLLQFLELAQIGFGCQLLPCSLALFAGRPLAEPTLGLGLRVPKERPDRRRCGCSSLPTKSRSDGGTPWKTRFRSYSFCKVPCF